MRRRRGHAMVLLLLILALARGARAVDVLAASKIEACVADGANGGANSGASSSPSSPPPLFCSQKLVLTVAVDASDVSSAASSRVELSLPCVGSPTGACPCPCDYARDAGCACRDLAPLGPGAAAAALRLSFAKTPVFAAYPLTYLRSFNWRPAEQIIRPQSSKCRDGDLDSTPTCGWYYEAGKRVAGSQGFCCECAAGQVVGATLGTAASATERTRANLNCDFFASPLDILSGRAPSSAHCLQLDRRWYGGYGVAEPSVYFEIAVSVARPAVPPTAAEEAAAAAAAAAAGAPLPSPLPPPPVETLTLSPAAPSLASANRTLSARLQGDLLGYGAPPPALASKVLMIPRPGAGQTLDDAFRNRSAWLLVDRARVSLDGRECDRVGTSFAAFRDQANGCKRAPGSCLANQLADLHAEDERRVAAGKAPLYWLSQFSRGLDSEVRTLPASVGGGAPMALALPVPGGSARGGASVVTVEVAADGIRLVTSASPGRIAAARVCAFGESARCAGAFEALAAGGFLHAAVTNTGAVDAAYTLSVSNCTRGVVFAAGGAGASRRLSAPANATVAADPAFELTTGDARSDPGRACWLELRDGLGRLTDGPVRVPFATNATQFSEASLVWKGVADAKAKFGEGDGAEKAAARRARWGPILSGAALCGGRCGSLFDVGCFASAKCWGGVAAFLGALAVPAALAALLWAAVRRGWLLRLCGCCCSRLLPFGGLFGRAAAATATAAAAAAREKKAPERAQKKKRKKKKGGGGGSRSRSRSASRGRKEQRSPAMSEGEEEEEEGEDEDERPARSPRRGAALQKDGRGRRQHEQRRQQQRRRPSFSSSSASSSAAEEESDGDARSGGGDGGSRGRRKSRPGSRPPTPPHQQRRPRPRALPALLAEPPRAAVASAAAAPASTAWDSRALAAVAAAAGRLPPGLAAAAAAAAGMHPSMQRALATGMAAASAAAAAGAAESSPQRQPRQQQQQQRPKPRAQSAVVEEIFSSSGGVVASGARAVVASPSAAGRGADRPRGRSHLIAPPRAAE